MTGRATTWSLGVVAQAEATWHDEAEAVALTIAAGERDLLPGRCRPSIRLHPELSSFDEISPASETSLSALDGGVVARIDRPGAKERPR
jgi:hypothetical protein